MLGGDFYVKYKIIGGYILCVGVLIYKSRDRLLVCVVIVR